MSELEYDASYSAISEMEELNRKIEPVHNDSDIFFDFLLRHFKDIVEIENETIQEKVHEKTEH